MKTPISYYGGKQSMVQTILPLIPRHNLYCEPFFGGGAIFFAKPPSNVEVINDLNTEVINFYRVLQNNFTELRKEVMTTLHSRKQHRQALVVYENPEMFTDLKRAWAFWCLSSQSFSAILNGGWGYDKTAGSLERRLQNKRDNFVKEYSERLQRVQIECNDAIKVIASRDSATTFFYVDPPYFNSDKGHYKDYDIFMFKSLLEALQNARGKFLLSSYPSDILEEYVKKNGWQQIRIDKRVAVTHQTKKMKTEVLTANYDIQEVVEMKNLILSRCAA